VKVAERFGQPPHTVADWPADWLAVAQTAMAAEAGAEREPRSREERKAKMARMKQGGR
jgi:hypothetical protein